MNEMSNELFSQILILMFIAWLMFGCGQEGEDDGRTETKVVTTDCQAGKDGSDGKDGVDGENGADGEVGTSGSKGDSGPQGSPGQSGVDGSNCRIIRELVYNRDGELRNRCDVYLSCVNDVVFITRLREACD